MISFESFAKTCYLILAADVNKSLLFLGFFFLPLHTSPKVLQSQEKKILKSGFVFTLALTELWFPLSPQPPMDFRWSPLGTTWNSEDLGGGEEKSLEAQKGSRGGSRQAGGGARYCSWVHQTFLRPPEMSPRSGSAPRDVQHVLRCRDKQKMLKAGSRAWDFG